MFAPAAGAASAMRSAYHILGIPPTRRSGYAEIWRLRPPRMILACPVCGNRMRLLATLEDPQLVQQILTHLGLPSTPVRADPAIWRRLSGTLTSTSSSPARSSHRSSRMTMSPRATRSSLTMNKGLPSVRRLMTTRQLGWKRVSGEALAQVVGDRRLTQ